MSQSEHSSILQIKYLHLLVQEFDVRVDKGLVEAILSMFNSEQIDVPYTSETFQKDLELSRPTLRVKIQTAQISKQKSFYHDLHVSPLMLHLSFSQGGRGTSKRHGPGAGIQTGQAGLRFFSIFQVLMKSVGVTVSLFAAFFSFLAPFLAPLFALFRSQKCKTLCSSRKDHIT